MSSGRKSKSKSKLTNELNVIDTAVKGSYMMVKHYDLPKVTLIVKEFIKSCYKFRDARIRIGSMYLDNAMLYIPNKESIVGNTNIQKYWLSNKLISTHHLIGKDKDDKDDLMMEIDPINTNPKDDCVIFLVKVRGREKICSTCWMFNEIFVIQLMTTVKSALMSSQLKIMTHSIGVSVELH